MIVNDWAELAFGDMALAPAPTWKHDLGAWSPRGSASVATLVRRMAYGGRKGRRAEKRLRAQVMGARWTAGFGAAYAARWASHIPSDMAPGVLPGPDVFTAEQLASVTPVDLDWGEKKP